MGHWCEPPFRSRKRDMNHSPALSLGSQISAAVGHCLKFPPLGDPVFKKEDEHQIMHLGEFPTAQHCMQSQNFLFTPEDAHVHSMSMKGPSCIPTLDAAKQTLPTTKLIVVGGVGFEEAIGRVVSFIRTLISQMQKTFFVHFRLPHASTLLDPCLGYHSLLPLCCQIMRRADKTIELVNGDHTELFIGEISPQSLESTFRRCSVVCPSDPLPGFQQIYVCIASNGWQV